MVAMDSQALPPQRMALQATEGMAAEEHSALKGLAALLRPLKSGGMEEVLAHQIVEAEGVELVAPVSPALKRPFSAAREAAAK